MSIVRQVVRLELDLLGLPLRGLDRQEKYCGITVEVVE
jgi:hypothetical protein